MQLDTGIEHKPNSKSNDRMDVAIMFLILQSVDMILKFCSLQYSPSNNQLELINKLRYTSV